MVVAAEAVEDDSDDAAAAEAAAVAAEARASTLRRWSTAGSFCRPLGVRSTTKRAQWMSDDASSLWRGSLGGWRGGGHFVSCLVWVVGCSVVWWFAN
jgi:hypothetical protein